MDLTPATFQALNTTFSIKFSEILRTGVPTFWDKLASEVPSTSEATEYDWLTRLPRMREWVGERVLHNIAAYNYRLKNKDWESTIELERNRILDDTYGIFTSYMIPELAREAAKQPDYLIVDALRLGQTVSTFDGQNFFDPSHPVNKAAGSASGTQSNYFTGTALTAANFAGVRASMMSLLGEDGNTLGVTPNLLVVPPQLEQMARSIINSTLVAPGSLYGQANVGAVPNTLQGSADILVVKELAVDPTTWYLLDTTRSLKPFIFQNRQPVQFQSFANMNDERVFFQKKYVYGADMRGVVGYSLWFLSCKCLA